MSDEVLVWLFNVGNRFTSSIYIEASRMLDDAKARGIEELLDQS